MEQGRSEAVFKDEISAADKEPEQGRSGDLWGFMMSPLPFFELVIIEPVPFYPSLLSLSFSFSFSFPFLSFPFFFPFLFASSCLHRRKLSFLPGDIYIYILKENPAGDEVILTCDPCDMRVCPLFLIT